jgi:hypothetical protein
LRLASFCLPTERGRYPNRATFMRLLQCLLVTLCLVAFSVVAADTKVKGYFKKDGTYVAPHYRSKPDGNPLNNYSYPGNYNPHTGEVAPGNPETYLQNYYGDRVRQNGPTYPSSGSVYLPRQAPSVNYEQQLVSAVQLALIAAGFDSGSVDGMYGRRTADALSRFQSSRGLPITGHIDTGTAGALITILQSVQQQSAGQAPTVGYRPTIPANAQLNVYGNGWTCQRGYRESNGSCVPVDIPSNAQLNVYGNGWTCQRGYRESSNGCVMVDIPSNAQLNVYGNGWTCQRGYRESSNGCVMVDIPSNAQLNVYGNGWTCQRGYRESSNGCVMVDIPSNAQLNVYGNGWTCQRGYRESGGGCAAVAIPQNGMLNAYGNGWTCQRGYRESGGSCAAVAIPQNGMLNAYGNGWTCQRGYRESGGQCVAVVIPPNGQLNAYGNGWTCVPGFAQVGLECRALVRQ